MNSARALLLAAALLLAGCPKPPTLGAPPKVASGPAESLLRARDARLGSVRAEATIRMRVPEGMEGAPGGKVHAVVLSARDPERARLEILTPLGTPGASVLLADGSLQVYQPIQNVLTRGPIDSPELERRSPLPVPLGTLPALLRGAVPLAEGTVTERREEVVAKDTQAAREGAAEGAAEPAESTQPDAEAATAEVPPKVQVVEVRRDDRLVQTVRVDPEGGFPLESIRYGEDGRPVLTVRYDDYGAVETAGGPIAFPQRVKASIDRPEGTVSLEVRLSNIAVNPDLGEDAFRFRFDRTRPPRIEELP